MVRLRLAFELGYDIAEPGCDFIFNIMQRTPSGSM